MKKKLSLLMFAVALLLPWASPAQTRTVTVGNWGGTVTSAYAGFGNYYRYSWAQTLYTHSDMGAAGWIRAIILDNRSTAANLTDSVKIYLGHTPMTTQATAAVSTWVPMDSLTLVWSRTNYTIPGEVGQMVIELDQPFYYDGTHTLAVVYSKAAQASSSNTKFGYTSVSASGKYSGSASTESYCRFPTVAGTNTASKLNIMFMMTTNQNDEYCLPLTGLHRVDATMSSATVAWDDATGASYEVGYAEVGGADNSTTITPVTVTDTFYTATGLTENTDYWIYVRKQQGTAYSGWDSIKVRTLMTPLTLPLSYDFEDATDDADWAINNATNGWYIDSLDQRRCMFISNDAGASNAYTISTSGYSWAWVDVTLAGGVYGINFDWRAQGESTWDYLRVVLVPSSVYLDATYDTWGSSSTFSTSLPAGWISASTSPTGLYKLNLASTWSHFSGEVHIPDSMAGTYHLAILWVNDASTGTQPPAAIDNISFDAITCYAPSACTVSGISPHGATINVTHDNATDFMCLYKKNGATHYDTVDITNSSYTFSGLQMGATYSGLVYTLCNGDTSAGAITFSFTTSCATLTDTDLPYTENFEAYGSTSSSPINACWTKGTSSTTAYPYPTSTVVNGTRSLLFYGYYPSSTSSTPVYSYAALPPIDGTLSMSDLQVDFLAKRYSNTTTYYNSYIMVGIAESLTGFTSATAIESAVTWIDTIDITSTDASSIHEVEVTFENYNGTGTYVVFYSPIPALSGSNTYAYNYIYLDDITLRTIPTCFRPASIVLDSLSHNAVGISWTPDSRTPSPSSWSIEYGPEGFTPGTGTTTMATDTFAVIDNLLPDHSYDIYVSADCNGDVSDGRLISVHTACVPVDSLPYFEGFEAYGSGATSPISACWHKGTSTTTAYPYPYSTNAITGSRSLYFYGYSTTTYSYAALPLFTEELTNLFVEFDLKRYATTTSTYHTIMQVGVMTDPNDISTFQLLENIDLTATPASSVHHYRVSFENYTGNGQYIAFYAPAPGTASHYNYAYLDNVSVDLLPTCRWPEGLTVDSIGAFDVRLTWVGSAPSFEVEASTSAAFDTNVVSDVVYDTFALLTGLDEYSDYYFRVRGLCSGDSSFWSSPASARTTRDCGQNSINIIDTIGNGTSSASTYTFHSSSSYRTGFSSTIYTVTELNNMGLQTNNRINGIKLHSGTTSGTIRKAKVYLKETTMDAIGTPVANDTVDRSTMTLVYSGNLVVPANSWVEIPFDSAFTYSGNSNLLVNLCHDTNATAGVTFYYTSSSPDYLSLYGYRSTATAAQNSVYRSYNRPNIVFDICTEVPTCMRPSGVAVTGLTDTSISLAWNNVADNYEVLVSTAQVDPDTVTSATIYTTDSNGYTITGLQPNTQYYMYVRSDCGAIGYSEWSLEVEGRTACAPLPLPYTEGFESYASGSTATISPCWYKGTNSTTDYPYPSTTAPTGSRSLYFYAYHSSSTNYYSYAALPMFQDSVNHLMMSFKVRRYSTVSNYYTTYLVLGVMSDPNDINTFVGVDTIDFWAAAGSSVHDVEVMFNNYTGNGQYIAIYAAVPPLYGNGTYTYNYVYVDDVVVDTIPTCFRPNHITFSGITQSATTVHWTAGSNAQSFDIEYGPHGFVQGTGTMVTSIVDSVDLTGLLASTMYDVYVRVHCSATDQSAWSFAQSFNTACGPTALPMFFDPDNYSTGTTTPLPNCWTRTNNATGTVNYYPYIYSSSANAHTGNNTLYYYFSTTSDYASDELMAFPEVDIVNYPMNTVEVSFWAKASTTGKHMMVGVMSDPTNVSTFQTIDTIALTTTSTEYTVEFSGYTGNGAYVALRGVMEGTTSYYYYIDDINISVMSHCPRAYNLTAYDGTATGATLAWTDTIGSTQWRVEYHAYGDTAIHTVTANSNPFALTGLTANTVYLYRVAPICSDGVQADWSRESYTFSTSQVPATVPYTYDFENGTEWSNWQTLSNNNVNWYRGNAVGNPGNAMYLSTDTGATRSWNMAAITNAAAYRDFDFGATPHGYELTFDALVGGSTDGNYDGITIMVVDPAIIPEASSTGLTSPWGSIGTVDVRMDTVWTGESVYLDGMQGVKRLVFFHFNQATASSHPYVDSPDAIDNITIGLQACERPYDLTANNITDQSALLSWNGPSTDNYVLAYRVYGQPSSTNVYVNVTGNSYLLNGLTANTQYVFWTMHVCSVTATDTVTSDWSNGLRFSTECPSHTLPYLETFDSIAGTTYSTAGVLPDCWQAYSNGTSSAYLPHVVSSGSYWYSVNSSPALTMTSGSATYGDTKIVALPPFDAPVSSCGIRFYYRHESTSYGTLEIGYVTSPDLAGTFHPLVALPATTTLTQIDSTLLSGAPANATRIALRWTHNASFYSVGIDNIEVWSNGPVCLAPTAMTTTNVTYNAATITWSGSDSTEVGIHQGLWDESGATMTNVTPGVHTYTFTGLTPNTQYTVAARTLCEDNMTSNWTFVTFTTDDLPCFAPTNIQVSNETTNGGKITWTPGGNETEWIVNVFRTGIIDTNITVINTPMCNVSGLYAATSYTVSVGSVCGGIDTVWCDVTATLTTTACLPPTNVTAVANGRNAMVTWTSSGANEYHVLWFLEGFTSGADSVVVTNGTTNATIENLEPGESYDIFVYAYCDGQRSAQAGEAHVTITGIDDVNSSLINLYPNPANTTVTVDGIQGEALVTIVDMNGRTVYSEKAVGKLTIDLGGMAQGAYFVRITGENTTAIRKLIVK